MARAAAVSDSPAIEFVHVQYRTPQNRVLLSDFNLTVRRGEILMLLGPSGSGKTTSLKMINCLISASAGRILVDGRPVVEWDLTRLRRHIGYAIQEGGLFPHYTVWENVALVPKLEGWERQKLQARVQEVLQMVGLPGYAIQEGGLFPHYTVWENVALVPKLEGWERQKLQARVEEVLQMVGLPPQDFGRRYPDQLSGGQRQRVGLARALAADPPILLMDEPFGALDPMTRSDLQREFKQLQQRLAKTVVFVTHDVSEALLLGDRIALMDSGTLCGIYAPHDFLVSDDPAVKPYMDAFRTMQQILQS